MNTESMTMTTKNTTSEWENPHELDAKSALRDAPCSALFCDCCDSNIRKVDQSRPHPAMHPKDTTEGWFCMGCLSEFVRKFDTTWQDADKAPPNVTVLVWDRGDVFPAHYSPGYQRWVSAFASGFKPTHWMPLISPPNSQADRPQSSV